MKWGGSTNKVEYKVTKALNRVVGARGLYILLALAALILLSGAHDKWGP